jgi:hypothetical protein
MSKHKAEKSFEEWRRAEEKYAASLEAFFKNGYPQKVKKESVLLLAELRGRADSHMDAFFKKELS